MQGKSTSQINPDPVPLYVKVKDEKLGDVKNLLTTHYGERWNELPELKYFSDMLSKPVESLHSYEEEDCEALEE